MTSDSVVALVAQLSSPTWEARQAAAQALAKLGPKAGDALDALWRTLVADNDDDVRKSAAEAIVAVQEDRPGLISDTIRRLKSEDRGELRAAATVVKVLGLSAAEKEELLDELWGQLRRQDQEELIANAFIGIAEITDDSSAVVTRLIDDEGIDRSKKSHLILFHIIRDALNEKWRISREEVLSLILGTLEDPDPQAREAAVAYLAERSDDISDHTRDTVLQALWSCLQQHGDGGPAFVRIGGDLAVEQLLSDPMIPDSTKGGALLLADRDVLQRWSKDSEKILPLVLEALESQKWNVRQRAADWLEEQADDIPAGSRELIIDALQKRLEDSDPDVLRSASAALRRLREREKDTTQDLVGILRAGDEPEQISAIKALVEKAGRERTREPLRSLLQEWVWWIAYGNKPLLVETAAEQMRYSPFAVLPLVDELEKRLQPSDDLNEWIRFELVRPLPDRLDERLALLEDRSDACRPLRAAASDRQWADEKLFDEMIEVLLREEFKLRELEVHRRIAQQLACMSDPRFFDQEMQDRYADIKDELNRHAIPVLARRLPREQDFDIRASMARTLGNVTGREAVEALAQAVVGEERTQTRRQELLSKYYLEPSKARSEEAAMILRSAVDEAKRTLRLLQGLNIAIFVVGLAILIGGLLIAFLIDDGTTRVAGVLAGVGGFFGVIVQLIRDPLNRIQNAMANLVQIETAFTSFIWELNLNGTYIQSQYVAEGILTDDEVARTVDRIEDAMALTMNLVAVYTEEGRQRIVTRINSLSPAVAQGGDVITIHGQHLQGDSSQKKERTGMVAVNHVLGQTEDVAWDEHEVRFRLPAEVPGLSAEGGTVWVSLYVDGMETNALPLLLIAKKAD